MKYLEGVCEMFVTNTVAIHCPRHELCLYINQSTDHCQQTHCQVICRPATGSHYRFTT